MPDPMFDLSELKKMLWAIREHNRTQSVPRTAAEYKKLEEKLNALVNKGRGNRALRV